MCYIKRIFYCMRARINLHASRRMVANGGAIALGNMNAWGYGLNSKKSHTLGSGTFCYVSTQQAGRTLPDSP